MRKVERAQEISDLDSQSDATSSKITEYASRSKKRKIINTKLTKFSSSFEVLEDSSGSDDVNRNNTCLHRKILLPEPPKLNGMFRK